MISPEQRAEALERANRTRCERAAWKRWARQAPEAQALRATAGLVAHPPDWALTWRISEVLHVLPRVGAIKVRRLMTGWGFRDQLRLGSMTDRQRRLVIEWALVRSATRAAA